MSQGLGDPPQERGVPQEGLPMARVGSHLGLNNTPLRKDDKIESEGGITQGTGLTRSVEGERAGPGSKDLQSKV